MPSTLMRQWTMLRLIPRAPRKVAAGELRARLAERGFETSARTIQRDLVTLSSSGFPIAADDRNPPYGWQWPSDVNVLDIPAMAPQTALAFKLAERFLEPLMAPATLEALAPHFRQAGQVLQRSDGQLGAWPDKVRVITRGQSLIPPSVQPDILDVVYDSLFEKRCFRARYRRRHDGATRDYLVNPLGLVFRDGVIYLICSVNEHDDPLQLAIHRMIEAHTTEQPGHTPADFELDRYLRRGHLDFRLGEPIDLVLRVSGNIAEHLEETPLTRGQTLDEQDPDGRRTLRACVPDTAQLRWWILGLADQVEVLAPDHLRSEIAGLLNNAARQYGGQASPPETLSEQANPASR